VTDTPPASSPGSLPSEGRDDWDTHWENFSSSAGRNPAQAFRRRLILSQLATDPPRHYLDIGSGQGDLAAAVAARWPRADVVGIELSQRGVEFASAKLPRARFLKVDLLDGRPPPEGMSAWATHGTCAEVIEHVDEPERFLRSVRRWLAPGASLLVTVPGGPMSAFDHRIGHRRHYSIESLTALLSAAGFDVTDCGGAGYPMFNLYRRTVIARGDRLAGDVDTRGGASFPARVGMALFDGLLRWAPTRGRRGWQLYAWATARSPDG
jgi:SAM-dependent methyltransferase